MPQQIDAEYLQASAITVHERPRVYLAGPAIFRRDAHAVSTRQKEICMKYGLEGLYPLDNAINASPDGSRPPREVGEMIYSSDISLIRQADGVVADISPFRGPSVDVGTAIEIGYATALGKPVVAYTRDPRNYVTRVAEIDPLVSRDSRGVLRDAQGMKLDDFGTVDNLMVDFSVSTVVSTFEDAIRSLAARLLATTPFRKDTFVYVDSPSTACGDTQPLEPAAIAAQR